MGFMKKLILIKSNPSKTGGAEIYLSNLKNALANLGKTSQNAFMVGDTKLDAIAAKGANAKSIGVLCGYGSQDELKTHCDFVCKNPLEAVKTALASM